jgi:hypothetical protein
MCEDMVPIDRAVVLDFLQWIRLWKPGIRSLSSLSFKEFMTLAGEYETSKVNAAGMKEGERQFNAWCRTQNWFESAGNDAIALANYLG